MYGSDSEGPFSLCRRAYIRRAQSEECLHAPQTSSLSLTATDSPTAARFTMNSELNGVLHPNRTQVRWWPLEAFPRNPQSINHPDERLKGRIPTGTIVRYRSGSPPPLHDWEEVMSSSSEGEWTDLVSSGAEDDDVPAENISCSPRTAEQLDLELPPTLRRPPKTSSEPSTEHFERLSPRERVYAARSETPSSAILSEITQGLLRREQPLNVSQSSFSLHTEPIHEEGSSRTRHLDIPARGNVTHALERDRRAPMRLRKYGQRSVKPLPIAKVASMDSSEEERIVEECSPNEAFIGLDGNGYVKVA